MSTIELVAAAAISAVPSLAAGCAVGARACRRRAAVDPLTGIANRYGLSRLETAVSRRLRRDRQVAVLVLDVRHFKRLNDTYGHDVGDEVLRQIAARLVSLADAAAAVRLGGDEFAAAIALDRAGEMVRRFAAAHAALTRPIVAGGQDLDVDVTIGAAIAHPGDDLSSLLHAADTAMYGARRDGRPFHAVTGGLPVLRDRPQDRRRNAVTGSRDLVRGTGTAVAA